MKPLFGPLGFIFLVVGCADQDADTEATDLRPYAKDEHAKVAAASCNIEKWHWQQWYAFDTPQPDNEHFNYEITSLPEEEVDSERGRTWDRTDRIAKLNECLLSSFHEQGVRVYLGAPGLRETIVGGSENTDQQ